MNSGLWKEASTMSDMAINKKKRGSSLGLQGFILDVKKYSLPGIIFPIILLIPALVFQVLWIIYDNMVIKYGIDTSIGNGRVLDPEMLTSGERRVVRILETIIDEPPFVLGLLWAFTTVILILIMYQVVDMYKSFFGSNSALVLAAPCSKTVLFISKFLAASLVSFIAIWSSRFQWFLISGGFRWDGSSLGLMSWRDLQGIEVNYFTRVGIQWEPILCHFALFLFVWLGVFTILAIAGKMQKAVKSPVIIVIGIVIVLALAWAFMYLMEMQSTLDTVPVLFVIPCILLLTDILLVSRYDAVTV